ncbi:MAG: hypothetical protein ABI315_12505 [Bacteroidia bacterium]
MITENKEESIIHSTKEGRLYIKTVDFFQQEKIKQTIHELLDSDIMRQIKERKRKNNQAA